MEAKMNIKNLMVSFCAVAIVLFLVAFTSAATLPIADGDAFDSIKVNGVEVLNESELGVVAGESITIQVIFTADADATNVRLEAKVSGTKVEVSEDSRFFDVEKGMRYSKSVSLVLPYELKDQLSDDLELNIRVWNSENETAKEVTLNVQRPSYNANIMSISTDQVVEAGQVLPVEVVVKNIGYNKLDDLYVKLSIPELGLKKAVYFGDIVALDDINDDGDDDDKDFLRGKFYLNIPYKAPEGIYTVLAEAKNDDVETSAEKQLIIKNDFSGGNIIVTNFEQVASIGESAEYEVLLVNPTNSLKVYRIVTPSSDNLKTNVDSALVSVPAGLSKTATITANAVKEGEYNFETKVFSGENLEGTINFGLTAEKKSVNAITVLTVILAIIFIVLLVVLIVLLGKKPKKSEEFGESYY